MTDQRLPQDGSGCDACGRSIYNWRHRPGRRFRHMFVSKEVKI